MLRRAETTRATSNDVKYVKKKSILNMFQRGVRVLGQAGSQHRRS